MDDAYMQRCLQLAALGVGFTAPNPMVGAVVVIDGNIVGEGFHEKFGGAHAEVNAIQAASNSGIQSFHSAQLYVNLEPCFHHGKTPPCVDLIIEKKIKKVIIGNVDPNPLVAGKSIEKLKLHGIEVEQGVLASACAALNKYFITYHTKHRPYITLKWAQSADGFMSKIYNEPVKLTNSFSDLLVHKMRLEHMSILVGGGTVLSDNPLLTNRHWPGGSPIRILIDEKDNLPKDSHVFNQDTPTYIFNYKKDYSENNNHFILLNEDEPILNQVIYHLSKLHITSLLVEGGASTLKKFIDAGLWDTCKIFITPQTLHNGLPAPLSPGNILSEEQIFDDTLLTIEHI